MTGSDLPHIARTSTDAWHRSTRAVSVAAGLYAVSAGAVTVAGWALDIQQLTDWRNDGISMFANTAACVMMCGVALLGLVVRGDGLWRYTIARLLAGFAAVVALLTIFEIITNIDLGIDRLLFDRPWGQRAAMAPMRMGPPASLSLLLLGTALILSTYGVASRRIASSLATFVVAIASLSLIGYWYSANELFGIARITGIAWHEICGSRNVKSSSALPNFN